MFVENYPQTGHHLVYNTLTRAFLEVDNQCLSMLYSLPKQEAKTAPVLQRLLAQGIVVEDEKDEVESFIRIFDRQRRERSELHATILTTYDCPMNCIYCYQSHIKSDGYMSVETMVRVTSWLEGRMQANGIDRCSITFYGGEPLMNFTPIEYIGRRMREFCGDEIKLGFAIVTSGLLLTRETADRLRKVGVRHLQITLDGDKDAHDKRRVRKDGSGTYDLIMDNLSHLVGDFSITILCNVDMTNSESAYILIDTMHSLGYAKKMKIIFGPIAAPMDLGQKLHTACPQTVDSDLLSLTIYAAGMGFATDLRPELKICGMLLPHHFVIDPYGNIYTCPTFLGVDEYRTGSIEGNAGFRGLADFALDDECLRCLYVPFCTGGCRYNALVEKGNIKAIECQKEMFSHWLPQSLKAHHTLRSKNVQGTDLAEGHHISERTSRSNGQGYIGSDRDNRAVSQEM